MIKGSIQEEDITIANIYAPNIGAPQNARQMLVSMKREIRSIWLLLLLLLLSHISRVQLCVTP